MLSKRDVLEPKSGLSSHYFLKQPFQQHSSHIHFSQVLHLPTLKGDTWLWKDCSALKPAELLSLQRVLVSLKEKGKLRVVPLKISEDSSLVKPTLPLSLSKVLVI